MAGSAKSVELKGAEIEAGAFEVHFAVLQEISPEDSPVGFSVEELPSHRFCLDWDLMSDNLKADLMDIQEGDCVIDCGLPDDRRPDASDNFCVDVNLVRPGVDQGPDRDR